VGKRRERPATLQLILESEGLTWCQCLSRTETITRTPYLS